MSSLLKKQIEKQNFPIFFDKNLTLKKWFPFLFQFLLTVCSYKKLAISKYKTDCHHKTWYEAQSR